jgi:hypothetical protein
MTRRLRTLGIFIATFAVSVSSFGQDRNLWRTAADIRDRVRGSIVGTVTNVDEARKQLTLTADDDQSARVTVLTDSVSTQYLGFGGVINGAPEVFTGSSGLANVRVGDRLEVRGIGRGNFTVAAETVSLLGRRVETPQTGVGSTRLPNEVSTPTARTAETTGGRLEGVVRQINANDFRIVIETDRREIINVRGTSGTPVYYRGEVYQIRNLEPGDRIRVEVETGGTTTGEVRARIIDVVRSVQESGTGSTGSRVTSVAGRVSRVDRAADVILVDTGRGEVRVDLVRAADATGRRIRASDLQVGDRVDISGSYSGSSDLFLATTVRFSEDVLPPGGVGPGDRDIADYVVVTMTGTVVETLEDSARLVVRDRDTGRDVDFFVTEDLVVRTRTGTYTTADKLRRSDSVLIKAFRDESGNHVAQTIRIRTEAAR